MSSNISKNLVFSGIALAIILLCGTTGYRFIGGQNYSVLDCLYMTVSTITTLDGEVIDLSDNPGGKIFTMFIALSGIGTLTYTLSNFTAFIVEGALNEAFRRRKMEKKINKFENHYIVCGIEGEGFHIVKELHETQRPHVIVDAERGKIERILETFPEEVFIEGDASDSDTLLKAGVAKAVGLFAATGDDNHNLVISLTAKQLNPNIRVVSRCHDIKNIEKIKKAGADAVVSPTSIGGLRMASEMVRPTAVSFLDIMLRDKERQLRIEEIRVPDSFVGRSIASMELKRHPHILLLAARKKENWIYNPSDDYILEPDNILIFMTPPAERYDLEKIFSG